MQLQQTGQHRVDGERHGVALDRLHRRDVVAVALGHELGDPVAPRRPVEVGADRCTGSRAAGRRCWRSRSIRARGSSRAAARRPGSTPSTRARRPIPGPGGCRRPAPGSGTCPCTDRRSCRRRRRRRSSGLGTRSAAPRPRSSRRRWPGPPRASGTDEAWRHDRSIAARRSVRSAGTRSATRPRCRA